MNSYKDWLAAAASCERHQKLSEALVALRKAGRLISDPQELTQLGMWMRRLEKEIEAENEIHNHNQPIR